MNDLKLIKKHLEAWCGELIKQLAAERNPATRLIILRDLVEIHDLMLKMNAEKQPADSDLDHNVEA